MGVLDVDGLVHAEASAVALDHGRVDEFAGGEEASFGPAGRRLNHAENDDRNAEEQRHHLDQPAPEVPAHQGASVQS